MHFPHTGRDRRDGHRTKLMGCAPGKTAGVIICVATLDRAGRGAREKTIFRAHLGSTYYE